MKYVRRSGFVLVLVITAIAVIGTEMFVLAGLSNAMLFQSNTAYLEACNRNLAASGLAWAELNIENKSEQVFNKTTRLDLTDMNLSSSYLTVAINRASGSEVEIQINTSCTRARRTINRTCSTTGSVAQN